MEGRQRKTVNSITSEEGKPSEENHGIPSLSVSDVELWDAVAESEVEGGGGTEKLQVLISYCLFSHTRTLLYKRD